MKNIKKFNEFLNESSEYKIDIYNVLEFKDKLIAIIATLEDDKKENLRKGLDFVLKNLSDYSKDDFVEEICNNFFVDINKLINRNFPNFWKSEDKGYTGYKTTGKNYEKVKDLSISEIAKLVKKELSIEFPEWKFSVKTDRHSLRVDILDLPYNPYSEEADIAYKNDSYPSEERHYNYSIFNEQFQKDKKKIESIVNQYNYNDSDSQIDYFNNNFYGSVSLEDDNIKKKYYPEHKDVKRAEEWNKQWAERTARAKAKADEIKSKFKFKRGDKVTYIVENDMAYIPKGEYPAVILKAPNGRGRGISQYEIKFTIDKKIINGELKTLTHPQTYTTTLYSDDKLK